ncbi:MAG TPA: hypothetical protein VMD47_04690 [Candidatus Acidoferrales bacterium]|nr:hypothetical protein [Candidatus Acidoferrales bacterium]
MRKVLDVFLTFLRPGRTPLGGPVASTLGECMALTRLLPGPSPRMPASRAFWRAA